MAKRLMTSLHQLGCFRCNKILIKVKPKTDKFPNYQLKTKIFYYYF